MSLVQERLLIHHCDVNNAYLNSDVDFDDMYMAQPEGYVIGKNKVCRLKKAIYGLKQAAHRWHHTLLQFLNSWNLIQSVMDPCVFVRRKGSETLIILIWVDDVIVCASNMNLMNEFKRSFGTAFKIKDLGPIS